MSEFSVRRAQIGDVGGINRVYNPYIETSPVTFDSEPYSIQDREAWLLDLEKSTRTPVFVALQVDKIVGFANAAPFDARAGYRTSVKTSIFLDPAVQGLGCGNALYSALFEALRQTDLHRAYALIVEPNPASCALHERFGFRHIVTMRESGTKFGQFLDVMWYERAISEAQ